MGSLFKSQTKTVQNPFESNPWEPQQDYLIGGFKQGSDALTQALQSLSGLGSLTAGMNNDQLAAIDSLVKSGTGTSQDVANSFMNSGSQNMANLGRYSTGVNDFMDRANTDRTDSIISNGQKYADSPYLTSQIDAAISDVNRGFQQTQGDINSAASGTGNINSTRAGTMEALAQNDAMNRAANISTSMRSNAYENGLNRALSTDSAQTNEMLSGLGALSNSGLIGADLMNSGLNTSITGNQLALDASSLKQQQAQNEIQGQLQSIGLPMDLISQYMSIVGGNYGSKGYQSTTSQSSSPFQQLLGGTTALLGAF